FAVLLAGQAGEQLDPLELGDRCGDEPRRRPRPAPGPRGPGRSSLPPRRRAPAAARALLRSGPGSRALRSSSVGPPIVAAMGELAGWKFCPRCQAELQGDEQRLECPACGFVAYASSKATAGALVEDDER